MPNHDVITIGASLGGVEAVTQLAEQLPADLPAALFIVLHISPHAPSLLPDIISRHCALPAHAPESGERIEQGQIYVARPDRHLIIRDGYVFNTSGPRENRVRPAIDPLFRSAAVSYGPRVIGVVLTGLLDDGTAGLLSIKRVGGLTVVQDPSDAQWPDMPQSALEAVPIDHVSPLAGMGALLAQLAQTPAPDGETIPQDIVLEVNMAENGGEGSGREEEALGELAGLICPECGGPLWELHNDELQRYRCKVGHAFTARALLADQNGEVERSLWAAMRAVEERASLMRKMAQHERAAGRDAAAAGYEERAIESEQHADTIRRLLLTGSN